MAPDRVILPLLAVLARVALEIAREDADHVPVVLVVGSGGSEHPAMTVEHVDGVEIVRERLVELLPEPLEAVRCRRDEQRACTRSRLANWEAGG